MKNSYHLKEEGFAVWWFEGMRHRDKAILDAQFRDERKE